jgi:hypothetical protein
MTFHTHCLQPTPVHTYTTASAQLTKSTFAFTNTGTTRTCQHEEWDDFHDDQGGRHAAPAAQTQGPNHRARHDQHAAQAQRRPAERRGVQRQGISQVYKFLMLQQTAGFQQSPSLKIYCTWSAPAGPASLSREGIFPGRRLCRPA